MLKTLEEKRSALIARCEAMMTDKDGNERELSAEEQDTFDAMLAGVKAMGGESPFTRQADLDRNAAKLKSAPAGLKLVDETGKVHRGLAHNETMVEAVCENPKLFGVGADDLKLVNDGLSVGGYLRSMVTGPQTSAERFALSGSSDTAGGYTVPTILAAMMIDRFRTRMVLSKAGAATLPLDSDTHTFAKITGDPTPTWRRENNSIGESEPTFGAITFHPKSLAVLVKASRELLQDSPNINLAIERTISESLAIEVDRVGLAGAGATEPVGLFSETDLNEITGVGALTDYSDFVDAWKLLLDDNAPDPTAAIISNREWATLAKLEDSTGQPLSIPPAVSNLPFMATSAVATTLGGGTESYSILGHFPDLILGMRSMLQIEVLKELFAGTLQYGFVAHLRMDTGVFHPESFCRLLGITP